MSAAVQEMSTRCSQAERLAEFARVTTDDVDEAAEQIGRIFCPHDLKPAQARASGFSARHNCAAFDGFSINYVAYGGTVSIDPGCLDRFFLVQIPLTGTAQIRAGCRGFDAAPGADGVVAVADGPDPDDVARLCASDFAARPPHGRAACRGAVGQGGRRGRVRSRDRSERAVWPPAAGQPCRAGEACRAARAVRPAFTGRDGRLARGAARSSPQWPAARSVGCDQDVLGRKPSVAARTPRRAGPSCGQCR